MSAMSGKNNEILFETDKNKRGFQQSEKRRNIYNKITVKKKKLVLKVRTKHHSIVKFTRKYILIFLNGSKSKEQLKHALI